MAVSLTVIAIGIVPVVVGIVVLIAAIKRNRKYPEKNLKHCLINVILTPLRHFNLGPFKSGKLNIQKSCGYAMKKTGLKDFGGTSFIATTEIIMRSETHRKQKLSNLGYLSSRIELNMNLVRRLKFVEYLKKNPDVLGMPLKG